MFSKSIRIASVLLIALSLASCATMSPEECRFANWNDVGLRDGLDGKPLTLLNARVSDCADAHSKRDAGDRWVGIGLTGSRARGGVAHHGTADQQLACRLKPASRLRIEQGRRKCHAHGISSGVIESRISALYAPVWS